MISRAIDYRLKVQPVYFGMKHRYVYEGPCRNGVGDELTPDFDEMREANSWEEFKRDLERHLPEEHFEVKEPLRYVRTDDWDLDESMWDEIGATTADADFYLFHSFITCDGFVLEFMKRFGKPCATEPEWVNPCSGQSISAAVRALNGNYEFYACMTWPELVRQMKVVRARRIIENTRLLLCAWFDTNVSLSSVDSFRDQNYITEKLGVQFRSANFHEMVDCMTPAVEGGNPTTPGRKTQDLTEEDISLAQRMADELMAGAVECACDREFVVKELYAYLTVLKTMDRMGCNAFTMPCPDTCSSRRLDASQFTPCLIHTLNAREGIPSACEYDTCTAVTLQALMAMTGQRAYNGNTFPVLKVDGEWKSPVGVAEKDLPKLDAYEDQVYTMHHSVPHNRMRSPEEDGPYALRHFTEDQCFGPVMRYDFNADEGQVITLCRIAPDGDHMFLSKAHIVCNDGYELNSCNGGFIFRVDDRVDFYEKQKAAGNHVCCVYGDYVDDMKALAAALDMEVVYA